MLDENKKMKTMGIFIGALVLGSLIAVFMSLKIYHHLSYIYLIWLMNSIFSVTFGLLLLILAIYLLTNTSDKKTIFKSGQRIKRLLHRTGSPFIFNLLRLVGLNLCLLMVLEILNRLLAEG